MADKEVQQHEGAIRFEISEGEVMLYLGTHRQRYVTRTKCDIIKQKIHSEL